VEKESLSLQILSKKWRKISNYLKFFHSFSERVVEALDLTARKKGWNFHFAGKLRVWVGGKAWGGCESESVSREKENEFDTQSVLDKIRNSNFFPKNFHSPPHIFVRPFFHFPATGTSDKGENFSGPTFSWANFLVFLCRYHFSTLIKKRLDFNSLTIITTVFVSSFSLSTENLLRDYLGNCKAIKKLLRRGLFSWAP
jgi:hypothetical protein